jgi:hypothetical protein
MALIGLTIFAQGALAGTIWLKDRQDHVCTNSLSSNPGQIIGYGGINRNGTGFTLTLSNPAGGVKNPSTGDCANIPTTTADLVFPVGNVVANVVPVTLVKTGTGGNPECLDQGLNLSGVTGGSSVGTGANTRTLAFSFTGSAGCAHPNYSVPTYQGPFQRTASIARGAGSLQTTVFQGAYHIYNETNPIPEPNSILLILAGASSLGLLALWRRKAGGPIRAR